MSGPLTPETPSRESMAAIAAWMRSRRGLAPVDATRAPSKTLPTMSAGPESKRGGITGYDIPEPSLTSRALEAGASWLPPVDVPLAMRGAKKAIGGDMKGGAGMMALSMAGMVPAGKLLAKGAEAVGVKALEHAAAPAARGIEAWHGSPHEGIDRFSLDALDMSRPDSRTFGHGLYLSADKDYANMHRVAFRHEGQEGALYRTNIRANEGDLMDYDRPLSEQPQIMARLDAAGIGYKPTQYGSQIAATDNAGAKALAAAGIPGMKYEGKYRTKNYVMFDPSVIDIVKGQP